MPIKGNGNPGPEIPIDRMLKSRALGTDHWQIQGERHRHAPSPQQDPILSFLHMFLPKSTCVGDQCPPPNRPAPPPMGNPGSATADRCYRTLALTIECSRALRSLAGHVSMTIPVLKTTVNA